MAPRNSKTTSRASPRVNRDTVVGIVGSSLLVAAMVVVFVYERANAEALDDEGEGDLTAAIAQSKLSGTVNVGSSDTKTDNITAVGPSNVTFTLTWTASQGSDTLRFTVTPPSGSDLAPMTSSAENDGSISLRVTVPANHESQGLWSVKVDFTAATADPLPGGIPPPAGGMTDSSVSYSVAVAFA